MGCVIIVRQPLGIGGVIVAKRSPEASAEILGVLQEFLQEKPFGFVGFVVFNGHWGRSFLSLSVIIIAQPGLNVKCFFQKK